MDPDANTAEGKIAGHIPFSRDDFKRLPAKDSVVNAHRQLPAKDSVVDAHRRL